MSDSTQKLKSVISRNRSRSHNGGLLVLFGLVLEVILAFVFQKGENRSENWGHIAADICVAIGVWMEIHFAGRASKSEDELQRKSEEKVAEANERAAILEKEAAEIRQRTAEIEKLTEWRHVSPEQRKQIADSFRDKSSSLDILIEYERSNPEAFSYACEIANIFTDAGISKIRYGPNSFLDTVFGLVLTIDPTIEEHVNADPFRSAGISLSILNMDLSKHLPRNVPAPNLYIFVAPKFPPFIKVGN